LFGVLKAVDPKVLDKLQMLEIMKRCWKHMSDIMEINLDNPLVIMPLKEVFYLP
jgi:L-rhamnose mutarotase